MCGAITDTEHRGLNGEWIFQLVVLMHQALLANCAKGSSTLKVHIEGWWKTVHTVHSAGRLLRSDLHIGTVINIYFSHSMLMDHIH